MAEKKTAVRCVLSHPLLHTHFHLVCVIKLFSPKSALVSGVISINLLEPPVDVGQPAPLNVNDSISPQLGIHYSPAIDLLYSR